MTTSRLTYENRAVDFGPPERDVGDLLLLVAPEDIRSAKFVEVASGQCESAGLPAHLVTPSSLTSAMKDMRDFALAEDEEQITGIYTPPGSAEWFLLTVPEMGEYDAQEKIYHSGEIPCVPGYEIVVVIHSHTGTKRLAEANAVVGEDGKSLGLDPNMPGIKDQQVLITPKVREDLKTVASEVVIGPEIAVMMVRTNDTPTREQVLKEFPSHAYVEVFNAIDEIAQQVRAEHPGKSDLLVDLERVRRGCEKYGLGLYLTTLGPRVVGDRTWVRFYPEPEDRGQAVDDLFAEHAIDK